VGDVSTLAGIQQLANDINQRVSQIDVLISNAGYLGNAFRRNEDGIEMHFAVNVLETNIRTDAHLEILLFDQGVKYQRWR